MAINAQRTVIGVFDERAGAENAIEGLQNAGFSSDQIYYSASDEGSGEKQDTDLLRGITRLFIHSKATPRDAFGQHLRDLGFSDDEIDHYENQHQVGHFIVAVKAPGHEEDALAILRQNGAHS